MSGTRIYGRSRHGNLFIFSVDFPPPVMHEFSVSQVSRGLPFLDSSRARGWHNTPRHGGPEARRGRSRLRSRFDRPGTCDSISGLLCRWGRALKDCPSCGRRRQSPCPQCASPPRPARLAVLFLITLTMSERRLCSPTAGC